MRGLPDLDHFDPTTPGEMVLWDEIKRLRRELSMHEASSVQPYAETPEPLVLADFEYSWIRLVFGAELLGNIEPNGRIKVLSRWNGEGGEFGYQYLISEEQFSMPASFNLAEELHRRFIGELLGTLKKELSKEKIS